MTIRANPMAHGVYSTISNNWPPPPSPDACTLIRNGSLQYHHLHHQQQQQRDDDNTSLCRRTYGASGYGTMQQPPLPPLPTSAFSDSHSYHAVLDGYMSGDNVDTRDDDDDVDVRASAATGEVIVNRNAVTSLL